jgi:hypothetical protein
MIIAAIVAGVVTIRAAIIRALTMAVAVALRTIITRSLLTIAVRTTVPRAVLPHLLLAWLPLPFGPSAQANELNAQDNITAREIIFFIVHLLICLLFTGNVEKE